MATASRRSSGAYNTLYTHVVEQWFNGRKAEEIVFKEIPLLNILYQVAKKSRKLPADITVRLLESKGNGAAAFGGYDAISTEGSKGAQAARFSVANYSAPLPMSWEEEMEFTTDEAIADRLQEMIEQQELTLSELLADDLYEGNGADSKKVLGLEQFLYATTQVDNSSTTTATALARINAAWRARQAANSIGGIQRVGFTSTTAGGTGWEPVTIDFFGGNSFSYSSGVPGTGLIALLQAYNFATYGNTRPNLAVASDLAYDDYEIANIGKTTFNLPANSLSSVNINVDNQRYKNAIVLRDPNATSHDVNSGNVTSGSHNWYFLNTNKMALLVDSRADFILGQPKEPHDQHAGVRHLMWRGQLIMTNPRYFSRVFDYSA